MADGCLVRLVIDEERSLRKWKLSRGNGRKLCDAYELLEVITNYFF